MRRAALAVVGLLAIAVGLVAERELFAWSDLRHWLPDLVTGLTLIGCGLLILALRRPAGGGVLLVVAGFSWWSFNFGDLGPHWFGWLAESGAYIHRGALFGLALALPSGRPRARRAAAGVSLGWIASIWWPLWVNDWSASAIATALTVIAAWLMLGARGRRRQEATLGLLATAGLAGWIAGDAVLGILDAPLSTTTHWSDAYPLAVIGTGVFLTLAVFRHASITIAERAVELEGGATLRGALRDLLGDRRLETGYVVTEGRVVDDVGRLLGPLPIDLLETQVVVGGRTVGVVRHDAGTFEDATTRDAVTGAVALASERARLRFEIDERVGTIARSRRRLVIAEDVERRKLAERLEHGAGATLDEIGLLVDTAQPLVADLEAVATQVERAARQVSRSRADLDGLARGLGGLAAGESLSQALERLVGEMPLDVRTEFASVDVPDEIASALWFTCSECLVNVVKHAGVGEARVALRTDRGQVILLVADEGDGGADRAGSGLRGLADRLEAVGGQLDVTSRARAGATIEARVPLPEGTR